MKEYMQGISVEDAINAGRTDTICWDCKNAMTGGCCWADPQQQSPVDGWTATQNNMGYIVHDCPQFIRATYGAGRYRTADDYILALETAMQTRKKQIERLKKNLWWKNVAILRAQNNQKNNQIALLQDEVKALKEQLAKACKKEDEPQ